LEKVPTENNLCDTSGNFFNIDKSGIQVNTKPDPAITEKGLNMPMFKHWEKRVKILR
jgi:hypothetical protein